MIGKFLRVLVGPDGTKEQETDGGHAKRPYKCSRKEADEAQLTSVSTTYQESSVSDSEAEVVGLSPVTVLFPSSAFVSSPLLTSVSFHIEPLRNFRRQGFTHAHSNSCQTQEHQGYGHATETQITSSAPSGESTAYCQCLSS